MKRGQGFRHITTEGALDSIPAPDPYAKTCIAAMKSMLRIGTKAWIQQELDHPSIDDQEWRRFIAKHMLGNQPLHGPKIPPPENQKLFRCLNCMDVGLLYNDQSVALCSCNKGVSMKALWNKIDDERHRPKRRGVRVVEDDDPREPLDM